MRRVAVLAFLLGLLCTSAKANYRFFVDEGAHANFSLRYQRDEPLDLAPYASFDLVFDELDINAGFLGLRGTQLINGSGRGHTVFLYGDGPQVASIPLTAEPSPVTNLWVTIGGFNSRDQAAQHVSGVISEVRLRPRDPSAGVLLLDDFSGPDDELYLDHRGGSGTTRGQYEIDPNRVWGGQREAGMLLYRNANPGVTGAGFSIEGDGTGTTHRPSGVPEPASLAVWVVLMGCGAACRTKMRRIEHG